MSQSATRSELGSVGANARKLLNVESPSFTPKIGNALPVKNLSISPKAAANAAFTPRGSGMEPPACDWHTVDNEGV